LLITYLVKLKKKMILGV